MEWIDGNHIKGEMSDEDFMEKVEDKAKTRDIKKHGRDGLVNVYEEQFEYKGVPYIIKIVRYYQIGVPLEKISGMNDIAKYAVLEYPPGLKELAEFLSSDVVRELTGVYEFLWRDTVHAGQEHWTLKQMVKQMHTEARECIDQLPKIKGIIQKKFQEVTEKLDQLLPK